jgi:hypothetical protein
MSFIPNVIYAECQHAECHYTECHYAECRDASKASLIETARKGKYKSNSCRVLYKIDLIAPGLSILYRLSQKLSKKFYQLNLNFERKASAGRLDYYIFCLKRTNNTFLNKILNTWFQALVS